VSGWAAPHRAGCCAALLEAFPLVRCDVLC
jgi:hypothetical protein